MAESSPGTPNLGALSLLDRNRRQSPVSDKKRPAEFESHHRRKKNQDPIERDDADDSRNVLFKHQDYVKTRRPKKKDPQLFDPKKTSRSSATPYRGTPEAPSECSVEADRSLTQLSQQSHPPSLHGQLPHRGPPPQQRKPGLLEVHRPDPRYPTLLRQPESRPISEEQLAQEVKSIYAGLTMVEAKCIQIDRDQTLAAQNDTDPNSNARFIPEKWQALTALHRTLLHEHHDFFLATQHPSASPALRRLASKYSMPARMWKHGIHSFLELLRRRLPESIDYMLAFIYLAYQMMALLYETVSAFEDTWIECLGDLGRYRMAIEDEDVRDREIWAGVARSWYSKAADRNPTVGRLYHHLAILARPQALKQLYYYARSLTCVKPFAGARESIMTLLDPILGRSPASYSHAYANATSTDTSFIKAHAILFEKLPAEKFEEARIAFETQLDNHIGRVTTKWQEQGVYIAVTNIAGLFDYGSEESVLRQVLLLHAKQRNQSGSASNPCDEESQPSIDQSTLPSITEEEVPSKLENLTHDFTFSSAYQLTMSTFSQALKRIGDKNVLPHVHVLMSFISTLASVPHLTGLVDQAPWSEVSTFLNTLVKPDSERPEKSVPGPIFPSEQSDNLPLPEDYLIRGQIWSQWYFPEGWFAREHDEEDRYIELASTNRSRTERILHLGYHISTVSRSLSYFLFANLTRF